MINIPFFGHIFVFSLLALSIERDALLVAFRSPLVGWLADGLALLASRTIRRRRRDERR
jgi:hypothetical protein